MDTEIIVALIVAVSTVMVAYLQYRNGFFTKKKHKESKESPQIDDITNNEKLIELRNKKKAAFDDREETYNELTVCIARHIIVREPDSEDIQKNLDRCLREDINYRTATNNYLDEINRIMDRH